ncbi:MAG: hypothetical protein KF769_14885 [Parvibaculum sp.]|nr:hypothetical protein [Parvibaculum sp.]
MLCQFANTFPKFVELFMGSGRSLRRRFREETITDIMMANLITMDAASRMVVEFPVEPVTGADMEWNFVNPDDKTFFRIHLQAKQAYGDGAIWTRHNYRELFHTVGSSAKLQAELLTESARKSSVPTYPLYIFYNPSRTCELARAGGAPHVIGVTLAEGYFVAILAKAATNRRLRALNRSLGMLAPSFFSLSDLFCPPSILPLGPFAFAPKRTWMPLYISRNKGRETVGMPIPPRPQEIRERLVELRAHFDLSSGSHFAGEFPEVPKVGDVIPDDVQAILDRRDHGDFQPLADNLCRWRVTFISASPSEERPFPLSIQ